MNSSWSYEKQNIHSMLKKLGVSAMNRKIGVLGNLTKETFRNIADD